MTLAPGETVIEFADDNDTAIITTRSKATVIRLRKNPSVRLLQDIQGDDPAILVIRADLIRFRAAPTNSPARSKAKTESKTGDYKNYFYREAFDPAK